MFSKSNTRRVKQQQIPVFFKGDSYELWRIQMETLFKSEGLWGFVETNHTDASDSKVPQPDYQKQDAKALFFIQQAVEESIFLEIAFVTSAKEAWSYIEDEYSKEKLLNSVKDARSSIQSLLLFVGKGEGKTKQTAPFIYIVPNMLRDKNKSSFTPRMFSIGPLHREDENLQESEGEKATHMFNLLSRLKDSTPEETLETCFWKVITSIATIRSCYAETIIYSNTELAKMMVIDGCFILEFLYRITKRKKSNSGDVMFVQFTMYDLLLLENQIPFLVLQYIFECTVSKFDETISLFDVIHPVLEYVNLFQEHKLISTFDSNTTHHHILGLLHECYRYEKAKSSKFLNLRFPSAVELDRAGVNFKPARDTEWPLMMEVKSRRLPCLPFSCSWDRPTLIIPVLHINDFTELVLRNLIAYEHFSKNVTQYVTSYAVAMDMLIDTEEDIAKFVESKVLVNQKGSNQEAAEMINGIRKEVPLGDFFYFDQWMALDRHYNGYWSRNIAWLKRTYFNNPWNIIALLTGILLFALTVVQTAFTVNPA